MRYRLYRIRGRTHASRRARLETTRKWLEQRGWQLVDYAEGNGRAMFETEAPLSMLHFFDVRRWRLPPGYWSGLLEEWFLTRNLVIAGSAAVLLLVVFGLLGTLSLHPVSNADRELEQWWQVTADRLNIREEPISNSRIVGILRRDERVLVGAERGEWIEVVKPQRGFVARAYLDPARQSTNSEEQ